MNFAIVGRDAQQEKLAFLADAFKQATVSVIDEQAEHERRVNKFLDTIIKVKGELIKYGNQVGSLVAQIEEVSWFTDPDDEILAALSSLLTTMRGLHKAMIKRYVVINRAYAPKGIAKEELSLYKESADFVKEVVADLDKMYFTSPNPEMAEVTRKLEAFDFSDWD